MSYMNRVWMTATVAVAQGHTEPGHKCKRASLFSAGGLSEARPLCSVMGSKFACAVTENSSDDSLRKVMYLNCWGQG